MPKGEDTGSHPGRQVNRARWEIVPGTETGSERVSYGLVGHGNVSDIVRSRGQHPTSFPTAEAARSYMSEKGLEHHVPEGGLPPSDASDVGWAGRKKR